MGQKKNIDKILDIKGFLCPLPTVITSNTLKKMKKGETLQIITNDLTTKRTLPEICTREEYKLLEFKEKEGLLYFIIRK